MSADRYPDDPFWGVPLCLVCAQQRRRGWQSPSDWWLDGFPVCEGHLQYLMMRRLESGLEVLVITPGNRVKHKLVVPGTDEGVW